MKDRCGCIIFAFQGRLKSAYTVLHTHTCERTERAREREREAERERPESPYMHSFNEHVHAFSTPA